MIILLTGASGLVGSAVARTAARRGHKVVGVVGQYAGELPGLAQRLPLDLADVAAAQRAVLEVFPDAIINAAALSSPAACAQEPSRSYVLNVALPAMLAQLAHHLSARYVHFSSEQVFDGTCPPYGVDSPPHPISLYARQKLESEKAVREAAAGFACTVRLPLLLGNSPSAQRSVHERLLLDWQAGRPVRAYTDEYRQVALADNVAEMAVELCERNDVTGLFHWAGTEVVSRYELAVRLREHFKLAADLAPVEAIGRKDTPEIARERPADLRLDLHPLVGLLKTQPQSLAAQMEELLVPPPVRSWYAAV